MATAANPLTSYAVPGRASTTANFFNGQRMVAQLATLSAEEAGMVADHASTTGALTIDGRPHPLTIVGMRSGYPFPNAHAALAATDCYIVHLPNHLDMPDTSTLSVTALYVPVSDTQVDPLHHPAMQPPTATTAAGHPTVLTEPATPFTMDEPFEPLRVDPNSWCREVLRMLSINGYDHTSRAVRVDMVLKNVHADTAAGLVAVHNARALTAEALTTLIKTTYPIARSQATLRTAIRAQRATSNESWTAFNARMLAKFVHTFGFDTMPDLLATRDAAGVQEWTQDAASLLITAAPQRHRSIMTQNAEAWTSGVTDGASLIKLIDRMHQLDSTDLRISVTPSSTGTYTVQPQDQGQAAPVYAVAAEVDLRSEIEQLRATVAELKAGRGKQRPKVDFSKDWTPRFGLCRSCEADPQSVNGGLPRQHWRRDCPLATATRL
jgi:hypothetical protein